MKIMEQNSEVMKNCIKRLREISKKNEKTDEYSLGDVLLLDHYEQKLIKDFLFTKEEVRLFSPSYYKQ